MKKCGSFSKSVVSCPNSWAFWNHGNQAIRENTPTGADEKWWFEATRGHADIGNILLFT